MQRCSKASSHYIATRVRVTVLKPHWQSSTPPKGGARLVPALGRWSGSPGWLVSDPIRRDGNFASRPLSGPRSIWLSKIAIASWIHGLGITSWDTRVAVGNSERGWIIISPRDASGRVVADLSATWEKRAWRDEFPRTCADRPHHLELHPIGRSERGGMRVPRPCREWRGLADLSATRENER